MDREWSETRSQNSRAQDVAFGAYSGEKKGRGGRHDRGIDGGDVVLVLPGEAVAQLGISG